MVTKHDHLIRGRFVRYRGFNAWCIRFRQHGEWQTHFDAVTPDGKLLGATGDGVAVREFGWDQGHYLFEQFLALPCSKAEHDKFYSFLNAQIGKPYDYGAIYAIARLRNWNDADKWYCSELGGAGLVAAGLISKHVFPNNRVTPYELSRAFWAIPGCHPIAV